MKTFIKIVSVVAILATIIVANKKLLLPALKKVNSKGLE